MTYRRAILNDPADGTPRHAALTLLLLRNETTAASQSQVPVIEHADQRSRGDEGCARGEGGVGEDGAAGVGCRADGKGGGEVEMSWDGGRWS